jgi:mannose-6-phosphate isomerase
MLKPLLLRPDNFTPLVRTPWAGVRIATALKPFLATAQPPPAVGESWELSVEPDFPSRLLEDDQLLSRVLRQDPAGYLGWEASRWGADPSGTALLVKLVDTAAPLSVQIHPADGDQIGWRMGVIHALNGLFGGAKDTVDPDIDYETPAFLRNQAD